MTRVTQDFDFTIHEDEPSTSSAADDENESVGVNETVEDSLVENAEEAVEEPAKELEDGSGDSLLPEEQAIQENGDVKLNDEGNGLEEAQYDEAVEPEAESDVDQDDSVNDIETHHDDYEEMSGEDHESLADDTHDDSADHDYDQELPAERDDDDDEEAPAEHDTHDESEMHENDHQVEEDEAQEGGDEGSPDPKSRRVSLASSNGYRRISGRTDALIQAAARAVVARIEKRKNSSDVHAVDDDAEFSILSHTTDEHGDQAEERDVGGDHAEPDYAERSGESPRVSDVSSVTAPAADDHDHDHDPGNDSSSHNEAEDDVFSEQSPRSSMGSLSSDPDRKLSLDETLTQASRSPRISNISQYDKDDFIPTARNTPRPPFRTPSSVRAMQMSSPPSSVYGSPRSSKRHYPTISRLGSPSVSAQYSPKGRSTPPRLKVRKEAPLVLLHVTLLPLRWMWADVLEAAEAEELSESAKILRDSWRQLQSRMGDTVVERGVLLPHPQNDYEVLEERVLEALELPLKRRARILECGHYLGPSNITTIESDAESDDEDYENSGKLARILEEEKSSHWCKTCRHEIKYESLGPGKVFRIKVYASNGLMKAGAWEACWKEMERIDVEIEPIVEASLQEELNNLEAEQQRREEEAARMEEELGDVEEQHMSGLRQDQHFDSSMMADLGHSPIPSSPPITDMQMEQQSHSLLSRPQSRMLSQSPNPPDMRMQEHHTSVVTRQQQQRFVAEPPSQDMHMMERTQSQSVVASPRNPRLLNSPPPPSNLRTIEDSPHSTPLHHRQLPPHLMSSPGTSQMRIEDRPPSPALNSPQSQGFGSSPLPEVHLDSSQVDAERRWRDEERLREIYGHTPPHHRSPSPSPAANHRHEDSYMPGPTPSSPSQEAFERREERRETRRKSYQTASLSELLLEACKVILQDWKNLIIGLLGLIALMLAVRGGVGPADRYPQHNHFPMTGGREVPTMQIQIQTAERVAASVAMEEAESAKSVPVAPIVEVPSVIEEPPVIEKPVQATVEDPVVADQDPEVDLQVVTETIVSTEVVTELVTETEVVNKEIRRIVETVTEIETVKVTATMTTTETETTHETVHVMQESPVAPGPCDDFIPQGTTPRVGDAKEPVADAIHNNIDIQQEDDVEKAPVQHDAVDTELSQHDEL